MKYLSTMFLIAALGGLLVGFSISLRNNEKMLDEARIATITARKKALAKHRRRARSYHAGIVRLVPAEPKAAVNSSEPGLFEPVPIESMDEPK